MRVEMRLGMTLSRNRAALLGVSTLLTLLPSGCLQYRTLPPSEAPKLSHENISPSGALVVEDIDGERVRIDGFRVVDVATRKCTRIRRRENPARDYCYDDYVRFRAPVHIELNDEVLIVIPNSLDRRHSAPLYFHEPRYVRIGDKSASRNWIIVGTAVGVGLAAATATFIAVAQSDRQDPHGYSLIFLPYFAGVGAAGLSLAFTVPLTRDLGKPVE